MNENERKQLIDQLDRSFTVMPKWVQNATLHSMGVPATNPGTGLPFTSFREMLECAEDHSLLILKDDFEDNGDLLPAVPVQ